MMIIIFIGSAMKTTVTYIIIARFKMMFMYCTYSVSLRKLTVM